MKNLLFVIFSALLFLTACQKDEDITITDIEIPDSEQITSIEARGFVTDELGNVLAGSTIQLFNEDGLLLGQTTTDQQGRFSIEDIMGPSSKLLIYGEKPNYNSSAKKLNPSPGNLENIHLQLPSTGLYPGFASFNPSDPGLIALTGSVIDNGGAPADAFILAYVGGELTNVVVSGQNGDYQLIVPSNEVISIEVYQICGSPVASFDVGPFVQDEQLADVEAEATTNYTISGTLLDCNGNPVTNGYALIDWSPSVTSSVPVNSAGEYTLEISDCYSINGQVIITGYDLAANTVSNQTTVDFDNTGLTVSPISVCEQDDSFVTFELDGVSYTFQPLIANVVEDSITDPISGQTTLQEVTTMIYQSPDGLNSFIITITGASNGTYFVSDLLMVLNGQPVAPISSDPAAFAVDGTFTNHTNTPGAIVEGTFAGTFADFTGQRTLNGSFKAIQQ